MPTVALLFAQCAAPLEECDLPRTLPWYFGVAIGAAWLTAIAGIVLLVRRRMMTRRDERRDRDARRRRVDARRGGDIEPW